MIENLKSVHTYTFIIHIFFIYSLEKQEIPMSLTCNGFSDCDDGCDEDICKGNHDKKSYMIISAILGKAFKVVFKDQQMSKAIYSLLNSPKKRTKLIMMSIFSTQGK